MRIEERRWGLRILILAEGTSLPRKSVFETLESVEMDNDAVLYIVI